MKSRLASRNSSSTVSMRFSVSGPVSSIFCVPSGLAQRVQHAARAERFLNSRVLRVVRVLRLLLGVEVVEVAEELVEAVRRRQELVPVAEVVLAELPGHVAERLQEIGDGRVLGLQPSLAPGSPTLVSPVRIGDWPVMKAARPAVQLCWPYQSVKRAPFGRDAVDVRRAVAHHPVVVAAGVEPADVVAPDDEDVRLFRHEGLLVGLPIWRRGPASSCAGISHFSAKAELTGAGAMTGIVI